MSNYRPRYHITPDKGWMNDIQKPLYINGEHHLFYLYNKDFDWGGNGTEWGHATSTDLVHWKRLPVAIPKYTDEAGDPWTGSAVVDINNTSGFGEGAIIALVTMPKPNYQCTHLWYSMDGGNNFIHYNPDPSSSTPQPVMYNPTGSSDFRDPKVIWHEETQCWVMLLAEGNKIGFYTSKNLKNWSYVSGFVRTDIGVTECPDLFKINLDEDPSKSKWVLMIGANGFNYGLTTGACYFVGEFDGQEFHAETDIQWLEYGADSYAGATWDAPYTSGNYRYYVSWMNNWAYAQDIPWDTYNGNASIVREMRLKSFGGAYKLVQKPVWNLLDNFLPVDTLTNVMIRKDQAFIRDNLMFYSVELVVSIDESTKGKFGIALRDGLNHTDLTYDPNTREFVFNRLNSGQTVNKPEFIDPQTVNIVPRDGKLRIHVLVDNSTVEIFINDGEYVLSNLIFPDEASNSLRIWSDGSANIDALTIRKENETLIQN